MACDGFLDLRTIRRSPEIKESIVQKYREDEKEDNTSFGTLKNGGEEALWRRWYGGGGVFGTVVVRRCLVRGGGDTFKMYREYEEEDTTS